MKMPVYWRKNNDNISQNLPIKSAGYTLVLAQSSDGKNDHYQRSQVLEPRRRLMPFNQLSTTNVLTRR